MNPYKNILWPVDPFAKEKSLQRSVAWAIKALIQDQQATIQPVYLFSAYLIQGPWKLSKSLVQETKISAQRELDRIIEPVRLGGVRPLHVLAAPYFSLHEGVDRITQLAKRWPADLVVTGTRARKGMKRFWMGSFAENLVLYSDVPMFLVNPHWKRRSNFKHVLFPTDFSNESKLALQEVLPFVRSIGGDITIFHKFDFPQPPYQDIPNSAVVLYEEAFAKDLRWKNEEGARWVRIAEEQGVPVAFQLDRRQPTSPVDAILAKAARRPGMIAMASHSGPAKAALLGSTTRSVVRASPYPVWVIHPRIMKSSYRKPEEPLLQITEADILSDLERIPRRTGKKAA